MQFNKPPTTINDQALQLIARGMVCEDIDVMKAHLKNIGYYRLGAYWLPFELPAPAGQTRSKVFPAGTDFADIISLYNFDRNLRLLVMDAIERIEVVTRANWINEFTLSTNAHPHLDATNFRGQKEHTPMLGQLYSTMERSSELFVKHYKQKYTSPDMPPLWAVCETMSLGGLSKWVAATKDNTVKKKVAVTLGLPNAAPLEAVLQTFTYVRNICAHHNRLWNRRLVKRLPLIRRFQADLIEITNSAGQRELENSVFNVLAVILNILNHLNVDPNFKPNLIALVSTISDAQRTSMGFPLDWRTRPAWV